LTRSTIHLSLSRKRLVSFVRHLPVNKVVAMSTRVVNFANFFVQPRLAIKSDAGARQSSSKSH